MKKLAFILTMLFVTNVSLAQDLETLREDVRVGRILDLAKSFGDLKITDSEKILEKQNQMYLIISDMTKDYGSENLNKFATELALEESSTETNGKLDGGGSKCKRKPNGTVNWDFCNGWETFLASLGTIGCQKPYPGGGSSSSQAESYYNCVQSVICKTC